MWIKSKIQKSNQLPHQNPNDICDGCEQNRINKTVNSIGSMAKKDEKHKWQGKAFDTWPKEKKKKKKNRGVPKIHKKTNKNDSIGIRSVSILQNSQMN